MKKIVFIFFTFLLVSFVMAQEEGGDEKKKQKKEGKESFVNYFNFPNQAVRDHTSSDMFDVYNGLVIEKINVFILNRLVDPIADNDSLPLTVQNEHNLKENYNKKIIYNQLLFESGDKLDPSLLADSERNIRTTTVFKDAIIRVVPSSDSTANVDVFVQDNRHWKIIFSLSPTGLQMGGELLDFAGVSQSLRLAAAGTWTNINNPYSLKATYKLKNIGGSQLNLTSTYLRSNFNQYTELEAKREFFAYNTKIATHAYINYETRKVDIEGFSSDYDLRFIDQDYWIAHSFGLKNINKNNEKMRLIISSRASLLNYAQLPLERDTLSYPNSQFYLAGIGIANRDWYGVKELYYFRGYQYVPKGFNMSIVGGYQNQEYIGGRWYAGVRTNYNKMYPKFGYMQNQINYGAFLRNKDYEQITLQLINKYFSNKAKLGKLGFRQFVNTNLTLSYERPFQELYNLSGGISGLNSEELIATKSIIVNLESVFYTPIKWWTSRGNFFFFADFGYVSRSDQDFLLNNPLYQGYGFGVRFQNLATAIEYMEISFGLYPNGSLVDAPIFNYNIGFENTRIINNSNLYNEDVLNDIY